DRVGAARKVGRRGAQPAGGFDQPLLVGDPDALVAVQRLAEHADRAEQAASSEPRLDRLDAVAGRAVEHEVRLPGRGDQRLTERVGIALRRRAELAELAGRIREDLAQRHLAGIEVRVEAERMAALDADLEAPGAAV